MQKNLKMLDVLQEIDLKIDGFKGEKELLLDQVAGLEARVAEAIAAIAGKNAELATLDAEKEALEESLAAEAENIARSEPRLKEIKTQKEYQAVSKEISSARKLKAELEEQILQKLGQGDVLKAEIDGLTKNLEALEQNIANEKEEVLAKIGELEQSIASDIKTREETVKGLPSSVMRRYAQLREQRRGLAVVEAKDGSCLGCNMNLPPQLYNSLFRGDELITCPHCQRMLILRKEQ